jgi:hypothetical protein
MKGYVGSKTTLRMGRYGTATDDPLKTLWVESGLEAPAIIRANP